MVLYLRSLCDPKVRVCRGQCGVKITGKTVFVVKSFGDVPVYNPKTGKTDITKGNHYIHFHKNCLKTYDELHTNYIYGSEENFQYGKLKIDPPSQAALSEDWIQDLINLGVRM